MNLTQAQALAVVSLATMKDELRIPATETSHDALLTSQIVSAVSFCARSTGAALADLPRPAIVAAVRSPVRWQPGAWTACGRLRLACAVPIV